MSVKIALAGNPNCGKTTLFNALTGSNQFVGNWPGVTVEKKEGKLKGHKDVVLTDLPGIYSLSPYTLEEVVARNYILQEVPDAMHFPTGSRLHWKDRRRPPLSVTHCPYRSPAHPGCLQFRQAERSGPFCRFHGSLLHWITSYR